MGAGHGFLQPAERDSVILDQAGIQKPTWHLDPGIRRDDGWGCKHFAYLPWKGVMKPEKMRHQTILAVIPAYAGIHEPLRSDDSGLSLCQHVVSG